MRSCTMCREAKSDSQFGRYAGRYGKRQTYSWCKPCMTARCAAWVKRNPERVLGQRIKKYWPGSTWQEALKNYMDLMDKQNGVCAICKGTDKGRRLAVDHHHVTLKVRGLLCSNCNQAIGKLKDSADLARMLVAYLEET